MRIMSLARGALPSDVAVVGVPVSSHGDGPRLAAPVGGLAELAQVPAVLDPAWCKRHGFTGKVGQTLAFRTSAPQPAPATGTGPPGQAPGAESHAVAAAAPLLPPPPPPEPPPPDITLVGVGDLPALVGDGGLESLRRATAAFIRTVGQGAAGLVLPDPAGLPGGVALPDELAGAAMAEGAALAVYRYDDFRTGEIPGQPSVLVIAAAASGDAPGLDAGIARGARIAESVCVARDLVNEPPSSLTPARFAEFFAERFAGVPGLSVEVWDEERIAAERLGGLVGVARGSVVPPRLVRVEYRPADPIEEGGRVPHLALVGKGITFDSGGLSLKTASGMETMKTDMGGAAAVLSAIDAAAALGSRIRITALAPLTENMPSGSATKPGDVLTVRNGKTIEVLNTDAEGRLVLADGLSLAVESGAGAIVDLATLTGAAVVALGKEIAGLLGNDDGLIAQVRSAGERAGEPLWPLPLPDDYRTHIDSEIADMRNVGRPGQAGSISAALLLREFVGGVPWAHLDIAGPSRSDESHRYLAKGGTGFGVRTLVELVTSEAFAQWLARTGDR